MEIAHRLTSTRKGTFLVSGVAAAIAAALILTYVARYRSTVQAEGAPVRVLVAQRAIAKGTAGSVIAAQALYSTRTIRDSQLLEGAFSDPSSLRGKVAARDIAPGSELTAGDFVAGGTSLVSSLTAAQRVVAVPLDSAHGLIGQISAGDHVDVYAGFNVIPLNADGTPVAGGQARPMLRLIMSDVPVVGVSSGKGGALSSSTTNVDLKVNDAQAAKLAFASDNGKIWLSLRPGTGATPSAPTIVTMETLLLGVSPVAAVNSFRGHR